jgi:hypothetical protein
MKGLPPDISIGFAYLPPDEPPDEQTGFYHLSTAPLTGFYDCLDGTSFSDISQENLILKGGELSLAGDVKIKIVSRDIIKHIDRYNIELLGCRATMHAVLNGEEQRSIDVFQDMLISGFAQTDEVSFEITLEDSTFANAGQLNLKLPQGYGGSSQLETSYGNECPLKLYKLDGHETQDKGMSQGADGYATKSLAGTSPGSPRGASRVFNVEYESQATEGTVFATSNGKPAFVERFTVEILYNFSNEPSSRITIKDFYEVYNAGKEDEFRIDRITPMFPAEAVGRSIQICSGKGRGNIYKITGGPLTFQTSFISSIHNPIN